MDCLLAHAYSCHSRLITSNNDSPDRWRRISSIGKLSTSVEMPDYPQDSVIGLVYTRILHPRHLRGCSLLQMLFCWLRSELKDLARLNHLFFPRGQHVTLEQSTIDDIGGFL